MERDPRPGQQRNAPGKDAAGVRTPPEGVSSADTILPTDTPTLIEYSSDSADTPTLIEYSSDSPTMVGVPVGPTTPAKGARQKPKSFASSSQPELEPGMLLADRYEIVKILGQGGMGAVYKATNVELDRTVAVKVIRPELAREKAIVDRFKQELLLAHQVTHRNVIRIYDLGEAEG